MDIAYTGNKTNARSVCTEAPARSVAEIGAQEAQKSTSPSRSHDLGASASGLATAPPIVETDMYMWLVCVCAPVRCVRIL